MTIFQKECNCKVVLAEDIKMNRYIGATRTHKVCGGTVTEKRIVVTDDRPDIEYR